MDENEELKKVICKLKSQGKNDFISQDSAIIDELAGFHLGLQITLNRNKH